jgi:SAM-dependent methyltransferase
VKRLAVVDWLAATHRLPCLDIRPAAEFRRAHLPGAGNIEPGAIGQRIHELPRKGEELYVVGGAPAKAAAVALQGRKRWELAWSDEPVSAWPREALQAGDPAPLWRPNSWLEEHWRLLPEGGRVFDVAMGSGRNAVFLAMRGYRVEGEDILPEAVRFARALAARHRVSIDAREGDLRRASALAPATYDGIIVFNFLDRELLPRFSAALRPGGVLLYETFTEEQGRRVGRPRDPRWLLRPMELITAFAELEVIAYRDGHAEPGRYVASLAAKRPG